MSTSSLQKPLRALGVTPWQLILGIALAGFYLGEMKPKLEEGAKEASKIADSVEKLNETVQSLTTKVEVHSVLLASVAEIKTEVKELRQEIVRLHSPKTAAAN
jgi:hypothetical protein